LQILSSYDAFILCILLLLLPPPPPPHYAIADILIAFMTINTNALLVRLDLSSLHSGVRNFYAPFLISVSKNKITAYPFWILFACVYVPDGGEW
jgi:hypothetical protein